MLHGVVVLRLGNHIAYPEIIGGGIDLGDVAAQPDHSLAEARGVSVGDLGGVAFGVDADEDAHGVGVPDRLAHVQHHQRAHVGAVGEAETEEHVAAEEVRCRDGPAVAVHQFEVHDDVLEGVAERRLGAHGVLVDVFGRVIAALDGDPRGDAGLRKGGGLAMLCICHVDHEHKRPDPGSHQRQHKYLERYRPH